MTREALDKTIKRERSETPPTPKTNATPALEKKLKTRHEEPDVNKESRKQAHAELLKSVDYSNKKNIFLQDLNFVETHLLLLSIDQDAGELRDLIVSALQQLTKSYNEYNKCFAAFPPRLSTFLKANITTHLMKAKALIVQIPRLLTCVNSMDQCKKEIDTIEYSHQFFIKEIFSLIENYGSISASTIENILLVADSMPSLTNLREAQSTLRKCLSPDIVNFFKRDDLYYETLNKLVNYSPSLNNQEAINKLLKIKELLPLKNGLEAAVLQCKESPVYQTYLERQIEHLRLQLTEIKNELGELFSPKIAAPASSQSGFFSMKGQPTSVAPPITTWSRHIDTSLQDHFLKQLLGNSKIATAMRGLKKCAFNISFIEYIEEGRYKVLFAISGSNDALNQAFYADYTTNGLNGLVCKFIESWNRKNPGVEFQFVISYNEINFNMSEGSWYCSEPKLAIEYSKIREKNNPTHVMIGQNNWSINPKADLARTEHDACSRHCQPRQNELLNFKARMESPIRHSSFMDELSKSDAEKEFTPNL